MKRWRARPRYAPATDFNLKGTTLGFLILQQLSYYLIAPDVTQT